MRLKVAMGGAVLAGAALAGCYSSTSNPVVAKASPTPRVTPTPTATPTGHVTPTPSPTPTPVGTPTPTPSGPTPTPSPTSSPTAQPQMIHIGFELLGNNDPTFGWVYFYSPTLDNLANVVRVAHGSQVVFINDGTGSATQHTAGGFGSSGFPPSNDNQNPFTQSGNVIDGGLTWSTGILNPSGGLSQVFTVGPPGVYYFGCGFHYAGPPSKKNQSMGDVIVSQ